MISSEDRKLVVEARIHPAIGVARVGNAEVDKTGEDHFPGPEVPNATEAPTVGYRDGKGRLKRQGARFRIFGYDKDGRVLGEVTDDCATIEWAVHVANKKAAWYNFDVALDLPDAKTVRSPRRNAHIQGKDRKKLAIDPGWRRVTKAQRKKLFDSGRFFGVPVYLGEIRYEEHGRLLFLGGKGLSRPASPDYTITTFANNAGWHDDISDGPVRAHVWMDGREIPVDSAWVITAPPNYAPNIVATQPLYDVIYLALGQTGMLQFPDKPSFTKHILPIFRQFAEAQWVNAGFAAKFGWQGLTDFTKDELIAKLATPPEKQGKDTIDPYQELRRQISFYSFRDPASDEFDPLGWPPLYGDAFFFQDDPPSPRVAFTITKLNYKFLNLWMQGNFVADYNPTAPLPQVLEDLPLEERPEALDHAALHFCIGGPFHPGCEATWNIRQPMLYRSRFRLRERPAGVTEADYGDFMTGDLAMAEGGPLSVSGPGDITKWLAVPWQTDTASCLAGYVKEFPADPLIPAFWPSRVPNTVLSEASYRVVADAKKDPEDRRKAFAHREVWIRRLTPQKPYLPMIENMIDHFHTLGVLERRKKALGKDFPEEIFVETLPPGAVETEEASGTSLQEHFNAVLERRIPRS